jgi:uncharacterized membrane protein YfcA
MILPFAAGGSLGALVGGSVVTDFRNASQDWSLPSSSSTITWVKLPPLPAARSPLVFGIGGAVSTALTMFLGATGPLVAALMGNAFETRQQVVANSAVAMTIQHLLKVAVFGVLGFDLAPWLPLAVAMIASGYLGTMIGARLLESMNEESVPLLVRIAVTVLAGELLRRAVGDLAEQHRGRSARACRRRSATRQTARSRAWRHSRAGTSPRRRRPRKR